LFFSANSCKILHIDKTSEIFAMTKNNTN
jgi:hypothetical protein